MNYLFLLMHLLTIISISIYVIYNNLLNYYLKILNTVIFNLQIVIKYSLSKLYYII